MGIRRQIGALVAVAVGVALTTGVVAFLAIHGLAQTMRAHQPMHPVIEQMVALNTLANTWFRRPSERAEQQWGVLAARLTTEAVPALPTRGEFDVDARQALLDQLTAANRDFLEAVERHRTQPADAGPDRYLDMLGARIAQRLEQAIGEVFAASDKTFAWVRQDLRRSYALVGGVVAAAVLGSLLLGAFFARRIGRRLTESIETLSAAAAQMAAASEQQQRITVQQAASVSQTTTTMDELAGSARRSNEQAQSALATLEELSAEAVEGRDKADAMVAQMDRLQADVEAVTARIRAVGEQADQIDSVTVDVADIAAQTNLLALNAAVEAVRAGEHGRGFSVVADEIRKLADESKASAARIRALVAEAQKSAEGTIRLSEGGLDTLREAVAAVKGSGEVFKQVLAAFEGMAERMQQIALTGDQQTHAIEQAVQAMETINNGANETVAALAQTNRGIEELAAVAERAKAML